MESAHEPRRGLSKARKAAEGTTPRLPHPAPIATVTTPYGFRFGPVEVQRTAKLPGGRVVLTIVTDSRHLDVYVTPAGNVRIFETAPPALVEHRAPDGVLLETYLGHGRPRGEWARPSLVQRMVRAFGRWWDDDDAGVDAMVRAANALRRLRGPR